MRLAAFAENKVIELRVARGSALDGQYIREIAWPSGCIVAAIRRNGHSIVPRGSTELWAGDLLTFVTAPEHEPQLAGLVEAEGGKG